MEELILDSPGGLRSTSYRCMMVVLHLWTGYVGYPTVGRSIKLTFKSFVCSHSDISWALLLRSVERDCILPKEDPTNQKSFQKSPKATAASVQSAILHQYRFRSFLAERLASRQGLWYVNDL